MQPSTPRRAPDSDQLVVSAPTNPALTLRALARFPDRVAFVSEGESLSYREASDLIGRIQQVFVEAGLERGDGFALLAGNRPDSWCAMIAAQGLGLSTTPLHPLGSLDDHRFQLGDAGIRVLLVDVANFGRRGAELTDAVEITFTLGTADFGSDLTAAVDAMDASPPVAIAGPDDVASIGYTGGTTGRSKGVVRRHRSLSASTSAILANFNLPDTPIYLAVAPISHVAGSKIVPVLLRGGTVHLQHGFDPVRVIDTIESQAINMTLLVPTMIYSILDSPRLDEGEPLGSLELLLYGASPMAPSRLVEGLERIGPVFSQLYGQSECYPIAVLPASDHRSDRPDLFLACGSPVASCEVALLDAEGNEVPVGEPGEICVRSTSVMDEYLHQPERTAEAFRFGWLHTEDIARRDEEGHLFIVDRAKDMIVSGGFNIYPKEVEDVLTGHPSVAQAAVFGIPDDRWGEAVTAVIVCRADAEVEVAELQAMVKNAKGAAHTPKRIDFVEGLPLTAVGKVDKKAIRAPFWAESDRQVG